MATQALYRRYRPQRFGEVKGQEPVVRALRNAAAEDRLSHAYLFSGPRGTGKTSTARILAKVLNCENVVDGEPCGECDSCKAIEAGTSMDVHELDAASNNGVDAVRDLIARTAIGTPGRTKVYILDEVHMLSTAASNALLKTLEEPPGHVVFILATTDPQKVLPTIKSRTQHLPFNLLGADELADHLAYVVGDAGLDVTDEAIEQVLREGAGSARDTLSALDRVAAGGGVAEGTESVDALVEALAERDTGAALVGVAADVRRGRDPRLVGETLLARLRDIFLAVMGTDLDHLPDGDREVVRAYGQRLSAPALTRALELLGEALVEMRQAPDPRIPLEVALVRLTRPDSDTSVAALAERLDRLERHGGGAAPGSAHERASVGAVSGAAGGAPPGPAGGAAGPSRGPAEPERDDRSSGARRSGSSGAASPADAARAVLAQAEREAGVGRGASRPSSAASSSASPAASPGVASRPALGGRGAPSPPPTAPSGAAADDSGSVATGDPARQADAGEASPTPSGTSAASGGSASLPELPQLERVWEDAVLPKLSGAAKARFRGGRFSSVDGASAVFALPNDIHRQRCDEYRRDVEAILSEQVGGAVSLQLVVDADLVEAAMSAPSGSRDAGGPAEPADHEPDDEETIDPAELVDAVGHDQTAVQTLTDAFGAVELIEEEPT